MANAKKCDRCGSYYQEVEPTAIETLANSMTAIFEPKSVLQNIAVIEKFMDLCPSCSESLKQWVKGKETEKDVPGST